MEWKVGDYAIANLTPTKYEKIRIMKIRTVSSKKAGRKSDCKIFYYICVCNRKQYMWLPKERLVHKKSAAKRIARPPQSSMVPDGITDTKSHITWCIVCGEVKDIQQCDKCPASFHPKCERVWLLNKISRENKDPTKIMKMPEQEDLVGSATTCPSCIYGPAITYGDIIWHKSASFPWWPAKILKSDTLPSCLLNKTNTSQGQWPILYYKEKKYIWAAANRVCPFLPVHFDGAKSTCKIHNEAINEASHDYIYTYIC